MVTENDRQRPVIEEDHLKDLNDLFEHIYKGDKEATALSLNLFGIAQKWDDLIDGDPLSKKDVNTLFLDCIFTVQQSPYWTPMGLSHHILNVFLRWRDSDTMERGDFSDDDLNKCYMLRAGLYDLFVVIAYYLHGSEWAFEIGPLVRRSYGEKLNDYKEEICQTQREDS
jgi:hypothetical protein